jgi:hypothetical protein
LEGDTVTKQLDAPLVRLSGLWEQTGRSGQTYLTGRPNFATRLVAFKNNRKTEPHHPDYTLFIRQDEPKEKDDHN